MEVGLRPPFKSLIFILTCLINKHTIIREQGGILKKFPNRADPNKRALNDGVTCHNVKEYSKQMMVVASPSDQGYI